MWLKKWRRGSVWARVLLLALIVSNGPMLPGLVTPVMADVTYTPQSLDLAFNGSVLTMATDGSGNAYIGGTFTKVGPRTGGGVPLDATTALTPAVFAKISGVVDAVVPDGSGGWYVAGAINGVGGITRNNLAHILSDGSLDSLWAPSTDGEVNALAVSGSTVYFGGSFTTVTTVANGTQGRLRVAAVNTDGTLASWNPGANNTVFSVAVSPYGVIVGGNFTQIDGQGLMRLALTDATSGVASSTWNFPADNTVYALAVSGSTVYIGGAFSNIDVNARNSAAAVDIPSATVLSWDPNLQGPAPTPPFFFPTAHAVHTIAISGGTIYLGGYFSRVTGLAVTRRCAAAFDASATLKNWDPDTGCTNLIVPGVGDRSVRGLAISGSVAYAVGQFDTIGGQSRLAIAALDADPDTGGAATAWNPTSGSSDGRAVATAGSTVFVGGSFVSIGTQTTRNHLAAIGSSGNLLTWDPNADGSVRTLSISGSDIYVGGDFTNVGGQARNRIAVLDTSGNASATWDPNADNTVRTLLVDGSTIYVGGDFTNIGGSARNYIAALDANPAGTGTATSWNPSADGTVSAMVKSGNSLYAGGSFATIGGQLRNYLAALDTTTGLATPWDPSPNNTVTALALSGTDVYIGGTFSSVGVTARDNLAALNASGTVLPWAPGALTSDFIPSVNSIAISGTTVFIGGDFQTIGGQPRNNGAAVSTAGAGTLQSWTPNAEYGNSGSNAPIYVIDVYGTRVSVGGGFGSVSFSAAGGLAMSFFSGLTGTAMITASVPATLTFSIRNDADTANSNSCSMGTLTLTATSTCSYRLRLSTNASGGFTLTIQADHDFATGSATMTSIADNSPVGPGTESYGLMIVGATAGGRNSLTHAFDQPVTISSNAGTTFDTSVSPVPTSTVETLESYIASFDAASTPSLTNTTEVTHFATIEGGTPAGSYGQTVTYSATGNF